MSPNGLRKCVATALYLAVATFSAPAWAVYPQIESFDDDVDTYTPGGDPDYDWLSDPTLDYGPPEQYSWSEIRSDGSAGMIEEVPSGFAGVTASHGDNFGVVYFEGADGPSGGPSRQRATLNENWSYQLDVYTDPTINPSLAPGPGLGSNGIVDFWWTSGVFDGIGAGIPEAPGYLTESGFTAEILQASESGPKFWRFNTTGGAEAFDLPLNMWVTLEVFYHPDPVYPDKLSASHRIWTNDHTQLLYHKTLQYTPEEGHELFLEPDYANLGGPMYTWFVYPDSNMKRVLIDEVGVGEQIPLPFVLGDMDGDGDCDNFDIQPFELALTDLAAYFDRYELLDYIQRGDIDGDGDFDNFDIQPFEGLLTGGFGPLAAVPEPSAIVLFAIGVAGMTICAVRRRSAA